MNVLGTRLGLIGLAVLALTGCPKPDDIAIGDPVHENTVAAQAPAPDLVSMTLDPVDRFVKAGKAAEIEVRLRLAVDAIQSGRRPPVNLALAVDTSGSMEGQGIEDAKGACLAVVEALGDGDRIAIVTYDTKADVVVPSTVIDRKTRAQIKAGIEKMTARGTTNMTAGLQQALAQVQGYLTTEGVNRIVLVGDGVPNDPAQLPTIAQQAAQQGISITTLGLGLEYDETLMGKIAELSGGKFHFVKESADVAAVLQREVLYMKRTVGRSAVLTLTGGPGITILDVVGHTMQPLGGGVVQVPVGDLGEGEERDVIVRLNAPGHVAGVAVELFDAELTYQDAVVNGGALSDRAFLAVHTTEDPKELTSGHSTDVERSAARASVASLVLQAIATARAGQLAQALALVDRAEKMARDRGRALDDAELTAKADEMAELRKSLPALVSQVTVQGNPVPVVGGGAPAMMPAPMAPPQAQAVREMHSAAVDTLQGSDR
jgi:Ca-activated chloride channel homolog